jgi:hypothetical protein
MISSSMIAFLDLPMLPLGRWQRSSLRLIHDAYQVPDVHQLVTVDCVEERLHGDFP